MSDIWHLPSNWLLAIPYLLLRAPGMVHVPLPIISSPPTIITHHHVQTAAAAAALLSLCTSVNSKPSLFSDTGGGCDSGRGNCGGDNDSRRDRRHRRRILESTKWNSIYTTLRDAIPTKAVGSAKDASKACATGYCVYWFRSADYRAHADGCAAFCSADEAVLYNHFVSRRRSGWE